MVFRKTSFSENIVFQGRVSHTPQVHADFNMYKLEPATTDSRYADRTEIYFQIESCELGQGDREWLLLSQCQAGNSVQQKMPNFDPLPCCAETLLSEYI